VKFHDALQMRLDVMSPPLEGVSAFMAGNNVRLTPGDTSWVCGLAHL